MTASSPGTNKRRCDARVALAVVVALAIPFSVTGAFLFLLMTGTTLSLPSFLGLVILLGIAVNNGIVLVDYVNLLRREHGYSLMEALEVGGARRLRPVLMTTLTTCGGMLPLALATGEGSELWAPMGRATWAGCSFRPWSPSSSSPCSTCCSTGSEAEGEGSVPLPSGRRTRPYWRVRPEHRPPAEHRLDRQ